MSEIRVYVHLYSGQQDSVTVKVSDTARAEEIGVIVKKAEAELYPTWREFSK